MTSAPNHELQPGDAGGALPADLAPVEALLSRAAQAERDRAPAGLEAGVFQSVRNSGFGAHRSADEPAVIAVIGVARTVWGSRAVRIAAMIALVASAAVVARLALRPSPGIAPVPGPLSGGSGPASAGGAGSAADEFAALEAELNEAFEVAALGSDEDDSTLALSDSGGDGFWAPIDALSLSGLDAEVLQ